MNNRNNTCLRYQLFNYFIPKEMTWPISLNQLERKKKKKKSERERNDMRLLSYPTSLENKLNKIVYNDF
jgi:hypothetical protein